MQVTELRSRPQPDPSTPPVLRIGILISVNDAGEGYVDFPGNVLGPRKASWAINISLGQAQKHAHDVTPVVLLLEDSEPLRPVIVGVVRDRLPSEELARPVQVTREDQRLVLEAEGELVLRCGNSSVTLRKDGKIVVRGTDVTSRASGTNKIKGASIRLN